MSDKSNYVAIMAGGIGSRFWPASRQALPKQFLDIMGVGKSLIRLTFERFLKLCPAENIFVVTNMQYRDLVLEHIPELSVNQVLAEPSRNNTAPCIAYTAFKLQALNPDAKMIVAPSDHIILDEAGFLEVVGKGLDFAGQHDALLTLGIKPAAPHTGYGYIQYGQEAADGVFKVVRFTEKPAVEKARAFVQSGEYLWNAGIFVWRTAHVLQAFQQHAPKIYDILGAGQSHYNTPSEQDFINTHYPTTPNISVDYALMEKADNIYTIPSSFGWSDLGSWGALYEEMGKDQQGNVVSTEKAVLENVSNCLLRVPKDKLVILKDLDDFIVIDEEDVLLIYPKSQEQQIKQINGLVAERFNGVYS